MALILADRVQETSTTTGTGTLTLVGATSGYQTFSTAIGNGNTCYYTIQSDTGAWEVGIGTVGAGTLARTTLISSSTGSVVSFSGTLTVFVTYPAEKAVYSDSTTIVAPSGALLPITSGGTGASTAAAALTSLGAYPASNPNGYGTGTVTSVTGIAPVVSSGGATPAISMAAATASVNGYLTSTDWTTFNSKGVGTVTSVSATAPITSTGGATPTIAMPAATGSVNGYLTSADWTTFNGKGSGTVASVAASVPSFLSISGSPITSSGTLAISYSGTALPIANGGTGSTTATGSGQTVLATSPTITGLTFTSAATAAPAFRAYISAAQTISASTNTKLKFNTKTFDTNTNYDNVTNFRFTPTVAGYYQVNVMLYENPGGPGQVYVFKNGTYDALGSYLTATGLTVIDLVYCNGSTDYLEAYYWGTAFTINSFSATASQFSASMVRSA